MESNTNIDLEYYILWHNKIRRDWENPAKSQNVFPVIFNEKSW